VSARGLALAACAGALAACAGALAACAGALAACAGAPAAGPTPPATLPERVAWDFERAVLRGRDAYAELFDFAAVGQVEKLLRRYDLLGRAPLTDAQREEFAAEDATPFSVARERRNLGAFFPILAARTVGRGDCRARAPISRYGRRLGEPFPPLPPEPASNAGYEPLRVAVNALIERGGVVGIVCAGGEGGLALVYTRDGSSRGYSLITMYDDVPDAADAPSPAASQP
jgi:hypothetical protein